MKVSSTALYIEHAGYLQQLQERYRADPDSVDSSWRCVFELVDELNGGDETVSNASAVDAVVEAMRSYGHLLANLNPLAPAAPADAGILPAQAGLDAGSAVDGSDLAATDKPGRIEALRRTYCGTLGVESAHIDEKTIRDWIAAVVERQKPVEPEVLRAAMKTLTKAEEFERIMGLRFPGKKRFGAEGAEVLLPTLERVLANAARAGITDVIIGTMHRGRLNIVGTVLGRPLKDLVAEFKGRYPYTDDRSAAADVPYHLGYDTQLNIGGCPLRVTLCPNPSHLEAVNATALGRARGRRDADGHQRVLCVVLHTDASVIAQGVVAETVQMSGLAGFETGGAVHIIVNNQIGFTTEPHEARTSRYCTGAWKAIDSLILHVNGDHPESALRAADLAIDFREAHGRDSVIDLVCYRRNGHNEVDEPRFTQPTLYQLIAKHPAVTQLFGARLIGDGVLTAETIEGFRAQARIELDAAFDAVAATESEAAAEPAANVARAGNPAPASGVAVDQLRSLLEAMSAVPPDLSIDKKLARLVAQRHQSHDVGVPWPVSEALAFASLLVEGAPVRLSGQDVVRGAFSHRHYVLTDVNTGRRHATLNLLATSQAHVEMVNSLLSEYAVLGFEYGYSVERPESLVMWEAQFGDFANGAQIVIDQFITCGAEKWREHSNLVISLPHGLEGQGPEHSSARLERLLPLGARDNITIAQPSTPANYFHLLRRQVRQSPARPLFIIGAKTLLRLPAAVSPMSAFGPGTDVQPVIASATVEAVRRVLLCSGKIAYELEQERARRDLVACAVVRIEILYPFPAESLARVLGDWPDCELAWVQEEPRNQGAWSHIRMNLEQLLSGWQGASSVTCFSRPESSSPAGSFHGDHERDQKRLVERALDWAAL
jgi:2-oxoglutarate dehydrogenase E1 component